MMNRHGLFWPLVVASGIGVVIVGGIAAAVYNASQQADNQQVTSNVSLPDVKSSRAPLAREVIGGDLNISGATSVRSLSVAESTTLNKVTVTGELNSKDLTLTSENSSATGKLYVSTDGSLNYSNGREQTNLSAAAGVIQRPGAGLAVQNGQLTNSGVLSLQGQSGNVTFSAGEGIELAGTRILNKGIKSVTSTSDNLLIATDGNGNLTISDKGSGLGNVIALSPSTPQNDATSNPSIWVNKLGAGNLLQLSTGATPVSRFVVDQTGLITAGTIRFSQVVETPSLVTSIGGLGGDVQLGNGLAIVAGQLAATGSGINSVTGTPNQITVTGTSNVTLSLPQDIAITSSPTFGGLTLGSALTAANGGTGATTAAGARTNLGAAASGSNNDITQLTGVSAITPNSSLTVGSASQSLVLQGSTTVLASTNGGVTNSLGFATPSGSAKTIVIPNASGTVAVSASGALAIDSNGNLSCPSCLTSPGGANAGVSSVNSQTGAITITAVAPASVLTSGTTITIQDASATVKGLASFDNTNLVVTNGAVTTSQNLTVSSSPTFAGLTLSGALSVSSGGTGLGSTPLAGQLLIGNGSGYNLATLTAGTGVSITNSAGGITISASGGGTCPTCANQALSNLSGVALNTSLLPGATNTIDLGSDSAAFRNGYIAGVVQVGTLDAASASALAIGGTNATSIGLNKDTIQASGTSLTLSGGATGTRPSNPTAGMLYFDTTTNQLIQYNGTKWVSDRSTSTKIVAASNSSQAVKDSADYVATGTADQTTINAALTAASGGVVYLAEGTYAVSASISVPNNTTLAGSGAGTLIFMPNGQNTSYNLITNTDTITGTRVTIRDMCLDGNMANQTNGNTNGIYLNGMGGGTGPTAREGARISGLIVKNMRQQATTSAGVYLTASTGNTITGNTFQGNGEYGVYLGGAANSNTINNNIFQNNGRGIAVGTSYYNTVSGNVFRGNSTWVVILSGNLGTGGSNAVTGNTIQGGQYGIALSGNPTNDTVTGNNISGVTSYGIYVSATGANISGNKIHDSGNTMANNGLYFLAGANNSATGNDITDTSCTTTCYGIDVSSSSVTGTYLADNHHSGTAANASVIRDNGVGTIYSNQPDGLGNLLNRSQGGGLTVGAASSSASLTLQGGLSSVALPVPTLSSTVGTTGTAGTTTYRYQITALDGQGETTGSTIEQTTTGNATLSTTNYNTITWTPVGGAIQYRIYRCIGASCTPARLATVAGNATSYRDQALGAPSGAVPTTNTTGGANFSGAIQGGSAAITGSLNVSGATLFKNTSDSTTAFQIQKSDSSVLFAADTTNMQVTIAKLVVTGNITVNGHIVTGGNTPTIAAGAAACTSPVVSVNGNDTSGTVSVTTGTGCESGGVLATVSFDVAFAATPRVTLTPTSASSASLKAFNGATTLTSFTVDTADPPGDTTTYTFNYFVTQ
jgi:parallel beta-helix repeat protein